MTFDDTGSQNVCCDDWPIVLENLCPQTERVEPRCDQSRNLEATPTELPTQSLSDFDVATFKLDMWLNANMPDTKKRGRINKLINRLHSKVRRVEQPGKSKKKIFDCQKLSRNHNTFQAGSYHTGIDVDTIAAIFIEYAKSYFDGCSKIEKYLAIAGKIAHSVTKGKVKNNHRFVLAKV